MKVLELRINGDLYWEWKVVLSKKVDTHFKVIESIENGTEILIKDDSKIQMFLINIETDITKRKEKPYESDILYWTNDIMLNAYSPYRGVIISKKLKNIILNYTLPHYHIYPIEIINSENLEVNNDYFLFYIVDRTIDMTLFNESEYTYYKQRQEIKRSIGDFNSFKEYDNEYDRSFDNENIKIRITKRVISTEADIIPSSLNYLCVKETFYQEREKLNGVTFKEISDIVIK